MFLPLLFVIVVPDKQDYFGFGLFHSSCIVDTAGRCYDFGGEVIRRGDYLVSLDFYGLRVIAVYLAGNEKDAGGDNN